jgi:hypothetical protein
LLLVPQRTTATRWLPLRYKRFAPRRICRHVLVLI